MKMQFREILKPEFEMWAMLFRDDREPIPFNVTRFVEVEVMNNRRRKNTEFKKEVTTVMARDEDEARNMMTNVLSVVRVEE